jgi:hypothetical protein
MSQIHAFSRRTMLAGVSAIAATSTTTIASTAKHHSTAHPDAELLEVGERFTPLFEAWRKQMAATIRRSKTDQEGHGQVIAIVRGVTACPVKAVKAWLAASGITEGPLFRPVAMGGRLSAERLTGKSVCTIVQAYAGLIGLDPAAFGAHSLRAGFLTSAARRGASVFKMRDVSRHRSMDVLQSYVRDADLFRDHAGAGFL